MQQFTAVQVMDQETPLHTPTFNGRKFLCVNHEHSLAASAKFAQQWKYYVAW